MSDRISIPALREQDEYVRVYLGYPEMADTLLALVEAVEAAHVLVAHHADDDAAEFWPMLPLADALARFDFT